MKLQALSHRNLPYLNCVGPVHSSLDVLVCSLKRHRVPAGHIALAVWLSAAVKSAQHRRNHQNRTEHSRFGNLSLSKKKKKKKKN